jgi:putative transposase
MAPVMLSRGQSEKPMIPHRSGDRSDGGVQYWKYVDRLTDNAITINMTQSGDPTGSPGDENAIAERFLRNIKPGGRSRRF